MKQANYKLPISIKVFTLEGDRILEVEESFINPSHLNMFLREQLIGNGGCHVFLSQENFMTDFIMQY
jgi:hypothetical protein